jgi:hypothetical protein
MQTTDGVTSVPAGIEIYFPGSVVSGVGGRATVLIGGSSSGGPAFANKISATFASTVNDANPTGWGPNIARIQATPASGGSTINGLNSTGFVDGQVVLFINESTTDIFTFANLSSSCSTTADQFFCSQLGIGLATYGDSVFLIRDNGYWIIK